MESKYKYYTFKNFNKNKVINFLDFLVVDGYFEYEVNKAIWISRYGDDPLFIKINFDGQLSVWLINGCNKDDSVKELIIQIEEWLNDEGTENIRPTPAI